MGIEIERRWLVKDIPPSLDLYPRTYIRQGYIINESNKSLRTREITNDQFIVRTVTYKSGSGISREEHESRISVNIFDILWLTVGNKIEKTRYTIQLDNEYIAELDIFTSKNLTGHMQVEVEFDTEFIAKEFKAPPWFGKEVTDDGRYVNAVLCEEGIPIDEYDR